MKMYEKIRHLREVESLTRREFASLTGISSRTLENIENKGKNPRIDVVEKISNKWPRYAYWLLTGNTDLPYHLQPRDPALNVYRLYDVIRDKNQQIMMTKPDWFKHLIIVAVNDFDGKIYALLEVKGKKETNIKSCILLDFSIDHSSARKGLSQISKFIISQGRQDLIPTSELCMCSPNDISLMLECLQLPRSSLYGGHNNFTRSDNDISNLFDDFRVTVQS